MMLTKFIDHYEILVPLLVRNQIVEIVQPNWTQGLRFNGLVQVNALICGFLKTSIIP